MSRVKWDEVGQHLFETGVRNCVLYPQGVSGTYPSGVAWNGITTITESPSGAEASPMYADDIKYLNLMSTEEFGASIEAFYYPDEFGVCNGEAELATGVTIGQQKRSPFGLCYKTTIGNDVDGIDKGYKLHLLYGALAAPSERSYATVNESPEAGSLSWELTTTPVPVAGKKPTASIVIDSTKTVAGKLTIIENILYGIDAAAFDATKTYAIGDMVTHASGEPSTTKTYKCKTAITVAAAWDAAKWDEIAAGPRLPMPDEIATIMAQG